jgi:hypothetical protein
MKIISSAMWRADPDPEATEPEATPITFIKLRDEKLWAPTHNYLGEDVLQLC